MYLTPPQLLGFRNVRAADEGSARLRGGIRAHPLSLLAGIQGSAHFFGQRGIEDRHDFHHAYLVHAYVEVQRQQISTMASAWIQAPGLSVGGITEVIAGDLKRSPQRSPSRPRCQGRRVATKR